MMLENKKIHSVLKATQIAERYCAYQERSQKEVRTKLFNLGLYKNQVEQIISQLITENYINEERFATAYCLGKFRLKGWGKYKIRRGLQEKDISDKIISMALKLLENEDYEAVAYRIAQKKWNTLSDMEEYQKRQKVYNHLLSRGFESDIIQKIVKNSLTF